MTSITMPQKDENNFEPKEVYIIKDRCLNNQNISYDNSIYCVFHMIMSIIAIYLSVRCNKDIDYPSLIIACIFPYFYIVYNIVTHKGLCNN
jgi:hypothetical protein